MAVHTDVIHQSGGLTVSAEKGSCPIFPFARKSAFDPPTENSNYRSNEPVAKVKLFDDTEAWLVTRHEDVRSALESDKLSAVSIPTQAPREK